MVTEHAWDQENVLLLTEGHIPDIRTLERAAPQHPKQFLRGNFRFSSREEAAAWTLSALARRRLYSLGFALDFELPVHTWVLGPPTQDNSVFAQWFEAESQAINYRILLHRSPRWRREDDLRHLWQDTYSRYNRSKLSLPALKGRAPELCAACRQFLEEVLRAYQENPDAVDATIEASGHAYWRSDGIPL